MLPILGALKKMRKTTISFVIPSVCVCLSVRLSVRLEQLGSHCKDFHETSYLSIFRKSVDKFKFHYNFVRTSILHEDARKVMTASRFILLRLINVSQL